MPAREELQNLSELTNPTQGETLFIVLDSSVEQTLTVQRAATLLNTKGDRGPQGPLGPRGHTGYYGSVGFTGSTGQQGPLGYFGSKGYTGSIGFVGSHGFTGSRGYIGSGGGLGYIGSRGPSGPAGYMGSSSDQIGFTGSSGLGYTGSKGAGYTGSASTRPGYDGSRGEQGTRGYAGSIGYVGSGGRGYTGSAGVNGSNGFTGSAGASDAIGYTGSGGRGYTGSSGLGYSGSIGFTGFTGSTGLGYSGSKGFTGSSGTGYSGSMGDLGYIGSRGYAGSAGNTGYIGSIGPQGPKGDTGYTGSVGADSTVPGYTGSIGGAGPQGPQGNPGPQGPQGARGASTWVPVIDSNTTQSNTDSSSFTRTTGTDTAWSTMAYSAIAFPSLFVSFKPGQVNKKIVVGFSTNATPTADTNILYGVYCNEAGTAYVSVSGVTGVSLGSYSTLTTFTITYDGQTLTYYVNGVSSFSTPVNLVAKLYPVLGSYNNNSTINNVIISPFGGMGLAGYSGSIGSTGYTGSGATGPQGPIGFIGSAGVTTSSDIQINSLGVGTAASGVTGEIRATGNITGYYSSDRELKENIRNIPDALDKIKSINGVYFDWIQSYIDQRGGEDGYFVRKQDTGVIAQEIKSVMPEVVGTREDGHLAVAYEKLVPLLIEAIKELDKKVQEIEQQIRN